MLDFYYNSIPVGRENAVTRDELARRWNVTEDRVRHIIAELRATDNGDNYIIFSNSDSKTRGYFKTDDPNERRAFMQETKGRAINTFKPLKKAQRIENGDTNQYSLCCNLKQRRLDKGLTNVMFVDALAAAGINMDKSMLSRIENGYVLPTPAAARMMAEIIDCEIEELFGIGYVALTS